MIQKVFLLFNPSQDFFPSLEATNNLPCQESKFLQIPVSKSLKIPVKWFHVINLKQSFFCFQGAESFWKEYKKALSWEEVNYY